ncbi:isopentenyl-diphosphate Delta-isomerase [Pseudomonas sp. B6002]|uniref:isopentenyl-diphosphate Delta-isomerase n=1 Tax=Pseudomonas sp. B6002 TaxID=2726978 RepID=UPI0015A4B2CE|nr:isopentenyl-diphosphate Delta-isomerase [Pseudomonas sp. B6002]NVZ53033.1 isopentenyl-diphosphate Delta-isomerase [Pseudomonas sp. B6002]
MGESLILVDQNDQATGTDDKLSVHRQGLLHRAFSIFIFDRLGRLMLQRRAQGKYHSAGLWTNTCCGHPRPGEATGDAAIRRLDEEMGFTCPLQQITTLTYRTEVPDGLIEHEFNHVYIGGFDDAPLVNPNEAAQWCWIELPVLEQWLMAEPQGFTAWFKIILADPASRLDQWSAQAWRLQDALRFQNESLRLVSRTFALTIPQLPTELHSAVANAYLLCRIADTIEDEPGLTLAQKQHYQRVYLEAVTGTANAEHLSDELSKHLTAQTLAAERELIRHMPRVLTVNRTLKPAQRSVIIDCLAVMTCGMAEFQGKVSARGLASRQELDRYCYCVAGVVGEMLTELFIDYEPELAAQRETLRSLAVSFGTGLQLTNILKDQEVDHIRGVCWLPQDPFAEHGTSSPTIEELIGTAHSHLQRALQYALLIPAKHAGIRRFLLWATGLALLTLRQARGKSGTTLKVSHAQLRWVMRLTQLSQRSDRGLRLLYRIASYNLPLTALGPEWQIPPAP